MKNKRGLPFMLAGLLLALAALCLSLYNIWDDKRATEAVEGTIQELLPMIREVQQQEKPKELIPDYILNPKMDMPAVQVQDYDYVGYLEIPALDLALPVMSEWSYPLLKVSPCRYTGTAYQNNLVIAAHNYQHHFGGLPNLDVGDEVIFTDVDGNVFTYTVGEMEQLQRHDIKEMTESGWDLTLFTCTIGGKFRFTVRCARVEEGA